MNDEKIFSINDVRGFLKAPQKKYDSFGEFVADLGIFTDDNPIRNPLSLFISRIDKNKDNPNFMWKAARQQGKSIGGVLWVLYNAITCKQSNALHLVVANKQLTAEEHLFRNAVRFINEAKNDQLKMNLSVCWEVDYKKYEIRNIISGSRIKFTTLDDACNVTGLRNLMSVYLDEAAFVNIKKYEDLATIISYHSRCLSFSDKITRFPKLLVNSSPTKNMNHPFNMACDMNSRIKVESEDRTGRVKPHNCYLETSIYDNIPEGMTAQEVYDRKIKYLGNYCLSHEEDILFS